MKSKFSLDWIFERIEAINTKQHEKIYGHSLGGRKLPNDKLTATGGKVISSSTVLKDEKSRFQMADFIKRHMNKPRPSGYGLSVTKGNDEEAKHDEEEE